MVGMRCRIDHDHVIAIGSGSLQILVYARRIGAAYVGRMVASSYSCVFRLRCARCAEA
jgi:hypothetical protein